MKLCKVDEGTILYGELDPAADAGLLFDAVRRGDCLGVGGLLLTEGSVTDWPAELRARIGWLLQQLPVVYAADEQTVEWGPHYAVKPLLGEHLGWTVDPPPRPRNARVVRTYGEAICAATDGSAFALEVQPRDGQTDVSGGRPDTYHLLHRFATRYGVDRARLAYSHDAVMKVGLSLEASRAGPTVHPDRVGQARGEAGAMLDALRRGRKRSTPVADLDTMLSGDAAPAGVEASSGRRRCLPGSVFDPATHYQADYYDGTGIEYQQPDGSWAIYHGTGLRWGGNAVVAKLIREVAAVEHASVLDVGCSSGDFLSHMLHAGWTVRGFDLSQAAIDRAPPDVRTFLSTTPPGVATSPRFDHVVAFDLLEHIWAADIPELLASILVYLKPGGIFWANVCTGGEGEQTVLAEPGVTFTPQNSWALVAGHVTLQRAWWWRRKLRDAGFRPRDDLANLWQIRRAEVPGFVSGTPSWSARNLLVVEKPR